MTVGQLKKSKFTTKGVAVKPCPEPSRMDCLALLGHENQALRHRQVIATRFFNSPTVTNFYNIIRQIIELPVRLRIARSNAAHVWLMKKCFFMYATNFRQTLVLGSM